MKGCGKMHLNRLHLWRITKNGMGRRALKSYLRYGYIPLEDSVPDAFHTHEQVSRTLEYAYDDFVLAQIANALGKKEDYQMLSRRAMNYKHVIDTITGYAQGRYANGGNSLKRIMRSILSILLRREHLPTILGMFRTMYMG